MATNIEAIVPCDTIAHFDRITTRIEQTIDPLIDQLIERKTTLLQEVEHIRDDFHNKETARLAAIQELDKTQQELGQMSSKSNMIVPIHEQADLVYQKAKQQLSVPTPLPNIRFSCPNLTLFQTQIQQLGELVQLKAPHYPQKREPILTAGKKGSGEKELSARGISLDEVNNKVYIADCNNSRVQVLSFEGDFLTQFGKEVLSKPWGIAVTENEIFVTDYEYHTLFQFSKTKNQLINGAGGLGSNEGGLIGPMGLSVDNNGDVFVADYGNHRVSVFTKFLKYKHTIGQGSLYAPRDVKLTVDKVVILDQGHNCVYLFSKRGDLFISCVSQGKGQECLVNAPDFLCLDCDENIIISDCYHHDIKIVSNSGDLLYTIGKKGSEKGEFIRPYGIAISNSGVIFVYSENPNYSLQLF